MEQREEINGGFSVTYEGILRHGLALKSGREKNKQTTKQNKTKQKKQAKYFSVFH